MRLGTMEINGVSRLVGAVGEGDQVRHVDLKQIDQSLPDSMTDLLALPDGLARAAMALAHGQTKGPFATGKLLAPVTRPGKVLCIGLNYRDHAIESNAPIPTEPICFSKFGNAVIGPGESVRLPRTAHQVDYEAELVVIIGRRGRYIPVDEAQGYVAGYTVGNDVSARDWQLGRPGNQWLLGKTPDTFAPMGPYLVTADEIADPHQLKIQLRLNGETMQNSSTKELIFHIDQVIAHVSQLITLEPGDVIFTGTPPGVGMARKPPVFLKAGDNMEVEIEGLGILKNPVTRDA
ncbi:MAG: fumarylacetoacetate hydrolase family protein [Planctomycetaceae bacterium]